MAKDDDLTPEQMRQVIAYYEHQLTYRRCGDRRKRAETRIRMLTKKLAQREKTA